MRTRTLTLSTLDHCPKRQLHSGRTDGKGLLHSLGGVLLLLGVTGCGKEPLPDAVSPCELACAAERPKLLMNFAIPPEQITCTDPKWVGDCTKCNELFKQEFGVEMGPGHCTK